MTRIIIEHGVRPGKKIEITDTGIESMKGIEITREIMRENVEGDAIEISETDRDRDRERDRDRDRDRDGRRERGRRRSYSRSPSRDGKDRDGDEYRTSSSRRHHRTSISPKRQRGVVVK
ncbi:hypothetical protein ACP275_10G118000 [Erythranthe tilingii]